MRLIFSILKWSAIALISFLVILFSCSLLLRNKVADIFLAAVNRKISTKAEVGEYSLSLVRRFPKASVELRDVTIFSSPAFDKSQFRNTDTDTLLRANSAFLEFSMTDLLKGRYNIESISIHKGRLNLLSDSSGRVNYEITSGTEKARGESLVIDLKKIVINDLETRYSNRATHLDIAGIVESGKLKSRISGESIDFSCNSSMLIKSFELYSASVKPNASVTVDLNLHQSDTGTVFRKGVMKLENFRFGLSGSVSSEDILDLKVTGQNIDLVKLKKYLPGNFGEKFMEYSPSGTMKTTCTVKGPLSRKENPQLVLDFSVENGSVVYTGSDISIRKLAFNGNYTNGEQRNPTTSLLSLENLSFSIGSSGWSGSLMISDFSAPAVRATFAGEVIASELVDFIKIPGITGSQGSFRINMNLAGHVPKKRKYSLSDLIDLNPEVNIQFSSFGISHKNRNYSFEDADGNIMFARNLWAEELVFTYKGQRFRINGEFTNFPAWLAGRQVRIRAVADISAGNFNPLLLMNDTSTVTASTRKTYVLPSGIEAEINFNAGNMRYRKFTAAGISGVLNYKPGLMEFKSLRIDALNGTASGGFSIAQNLNKSFMTRGIFTFENVDVNLAFRSFSNFGQDFLKAENIAGTLSGSLSILMPLDSLLNPEIKSITAEGKYVLENGALLDFEPVKALSGFIELSELENISFSRLENDLFISNNHLAIPQMDIKSSAADFTVNGKHSFDNNYEYHVKAYLSEILSKKIRKNHNYSNEFGTVEDDGLGRTSVFLKVTGQGEDVKVTYDIKAAGSNIKQNLKKEKNSLKNILNEEYGLFRGDSTVRGETAPKPRFRIEFQETDTSAIQKDTIAVEENKGINRIFRRKKGG